MSTSTKPFLRGRFHEASFFFGLGACLMLVLAAPNSTAATAAFIYSLCLASLFGISSLYHRITWSERPRKWLRKLDHSAIYLFIAGTATPICLLGLSPEQGKKLLLVFWLFALAGICKEFLWTHAPRWSSSLIYVTMGWLASPYLGQFYQGLGFRNTMLFLIGGVIYTVGAVIYALKKPNPYPKIFGYHEIFHLFVMVACLCHFLVIYDLIHRPLL